MKKEMKLSIKLALLLGLVSCMMLISFYFVQLAYADAVESGNSSNQSCLEDYETDCEKFRTDHTDCLYKEYEGVSHTYHVEQSGKDTRFNVFHIDRDGKHFDIQYDYRGYYGNRPETIGRKANIHYFYNSKTKDLYLIAMKGSDIGYDTMEYPWGTNVFEDNVSYDDDTEYCIADNVVNIYFDTDIEAVRLRSFKNLKVLEKVDILGQLYSSSNLYYIGNLSFNYCGINKPDSRVYMDFLNGRYFNADKMLSEDYSFWREGTNATYHKYEQYKLKAN